MATVPTRSGSPRQLTTKQTGDAWEAQARRWLEGKGLRFIAANVNERGGEIDLIMREGRTTIFVEVRYRRSALYGGAAASVTRSKQHKLLQTAGLPFRRRFVGMIRCASVASGIRAQLPDAAQVCRHDKTRQRRIRHLRIIIK